MSKGQFAPNSRYTASSYISIFLIWHGDYGVGTNLAITNFEIVNEYIHLRVHIIDSLKPFNGLTPFKRVNKKGLDLGLRESFNYAQLV